MLDYHCRRTHDQLLFSFFHAAGHILLHDRNCPTFLEIDREDSAKDEEEADMFAVNLLATQFNRESR
jgi:Zn-dependent peptidase ImmA (M78 family)